MLAGKEWGLLMVFEIGVISVIGVLFGATLLTLLIFPVSYSSPVGRECGAASSLRNLVATAHSLQSPAKRTNCKLLAVFVSEAPKGI